MRTVRLTDEELELLRDLMTNRNRENESEEEVERNDRIYASLSRKGI